VAQLFSLGIMRPKLSTADWPQAILFAVLFPVYLFALPHAPLFVRLPIGLLITLGGFYCAASALRERWRLSKTAGHFSSYYLRLAAVAIAIIIAWVLVVFVIGKLFFR
jgi:hypothetical protein